MGKNKVARWKELGTFPNVIQPDSPTISGKGHRIKGNWRSDIFMNENPVVLELGCGKGEYTTGLSQIYPGMNFIGIDIKGARMWRGAKTASEAGSQNTAFLRTRIEFIDSFFDENEVDEIWITFPDPHLDKRNSNKRLTCPWFLNKYRTFLKNNGIIHLKTDNSELFNYTCKLVAENSLDLLVSTDDLYTACVADRISFSKLYARSPDPGITDSILSLRTHYEKMFLEDGFKINYLAFRLEKDKIVYDSWKKTCR
ncbi:MAG: tRNA (guanosine(46)-N7)-methyltransferase TrmB [Bacteroidales bacterium]